MNIIQTIILAAIEGITEFLPVSSTGHMILASSLMNIHDNAFVKSFEIAIQIGAIGAIIMLYYKRFLKGIKIYIKLGIAFIPTAMIGFLAYKTIKMHLFNPLIVSTALIVGGVILILVDKRVVNSKTQYMELEDI
ncbi:MAG TPA: undecaprenyl-diphosphate phosphatase, partial [Smithella sp.]|nr:undecaprenyl-diphosphate phosphatase [Smithella sp.]